MADLPREREGHILKNPSELKRASKPASASSSPGHLSMPTDHGYRDHAGQVNRRTDRAVRAQSPPQPHRDKEINQAKLNDNRKKKANFLGGGEGSDSDDDDNQRDPGKERESVVIRKRKQTTSDIDPEPKSRPTMNRLRERSTPMTFTPEEEERIKLQRFTTSRRGSDEEDWQRLLSARRTRRRHSGSAKEAILREIRNKRWLRDYVETSLPQEPLQRLPPVFNSKEPIRRAKHVFDIEEMRRREYLDLALGEWNTESNYLTVKSISEYEVRVKAVEQAESKLVMWWSQFITPTGPGILGIFNNFMQPQQWQYYENQLVPYDTFVPWYEQRLMSLLGFRSGYGQPWIDESKYLEAVNFIAISRSKKQNDGIETLSKEYIDWVWSDGAPKYLDTYLQKLRQQVLGNEIRAILGPGSIEQEFYQETNKNIMSVVLFEAGTQIFKQEVFNLDLRDLGWRFKKDDRDATSGIFYCYETDKILGHTFKMSIDGEVLGLWTPEREICWRDGTLDIDRTPIIRATPH
ncbi:hypothetical protein F4777DRAFT_567496 [Nemania sp. FL0916]|nr:hypothetical protein F4777DRAFT_567496 [Nemania sp. FL0916]